MKFWDREKEIRDLKRHIESEPNAILFVYGPKSSGKSTLLDYVIKEIKKEKKHLFAKKYQIYWFDLRGKFLPNYESVMDIFFSKKKSTKKQKASAIELQEPIFKSFKVSASIYKEIKDKEIDPFEYIEEKIRKSGKRTVIVFDEIQRLKEIYINGQRKVVDAFLNFFVRLTKVLHLAHVIVMSSDTFFIEEVYSDSALKNTSRYYLVDFFDDETAYSILVNEGIDEKTAKEIVDKAGGVPWILEEIVESDEPIQTLKELCKETKAKLENFLLEYAKEEEAKKVLNEILEGRNKPVKRNIKIIKDLVEKEILFYDPINVNVRFQTRLDKIAAKEILSDK